MGFTEEELENYGFGVGSNTDSCENIYEKTDSDQEKEEQKKVRHEEDLTLIQGIIDVFWIEKDGIVLLDYKTDRVQQAKELIDRYETQLKLYADALERVFGARKLKVKEILIYSFSLEQLITGVRAGIFHLKSYNRRTKWDRSYLPRHRREEKNC